MNSGDVIFFSGRGVDGKANALAQSAYRMRFGKWSHVAISIDGPLVIHAMPDHGVHVAVLEREWINDERYIVARASAASEPGFAEKLENACIYWLGERYTLINSWRAYQRNRGSAVGESFCSLLVQKIYSRMSVDPFREEKEPLLPIDLYKLLSGHRSWSILEREPLSASETDPVSVAIYHLKKFNMSTRSWLNAKAGALEMAGEAIGGAATLIALRPDLSNQQKIEKIKELAQQIEGYEANAIFQYRNISPSSLQRKQILPTGHLPTAAGCSIVPL